MVVLLSKNYICWLDLFNGFMQLNILFSRSKKYSFSCRRGTPFYPLPFRGADFCSRSRRLLSALRADLCSLFCFPWGGPLRGEGKAKRTPLSPSFYPPYPKRGGGERDGCYWHY